DRLRRGLRDRVIGERERLTDCARHLSLPLLRNRVAACGQTVRAERERLDGALVRAVSMSRARLNASAGGLRPQPLLSRVRSERERLVRTGLAPQLLGRRLVQAKERYAT